MTYNPYIHHRRSIRLEGYDYSQGGAYYVTLCVQNRECLFGDILNGNMHLYESGQIIQKCWKQINKRFPHVELDHFIVMPNHIHGIIIINDHVTRARSPRPQLPLVILLPGLNINPQNILTIFIRPRG